MEVKNEKTRTRKKPTKRTVIAASLSVTFTMCTMVLLCAFASTKQHEPAVTTAPAVSVESVVVQPPAQEHVLQVSQELWRSEDIYRLAYFATEMEEVISVQAVLEGEYEVKAVTTTCIGGDACASILALPGDTNSISIADISYTIGDTVTLFMLLKA